MFAVTKKAKAGQKNGPSKSLNYLKSLQRYCNELLSCDPKVNQSVHLIQFLHPKNEELQAGYSKNGYVCLSHCHTKTHTWLSKKEVTLHF